MKVGKRLFVPPWPSNKTGKGLPERQSFFMERIIQLLGVEFRKGQTKGKLIEKGK